MGQVRNAACIEENIAVLQAKLAAVREEKKAKDQEEGEGDPVVDFQDDVVGIGSGRDGGVVDAIEALIRAAKERVTRAVDWGWGVGRGEDLEMRGERVGRDGGVVHDAETPKGEREDEEHAEGKEAKSDVEHEGDAQRSGVAKRLFGFGEVGVGKRILHAGMITKEYGGVWGQKNARRGARRAGSVFARVDMTKTWAGTPTPHYLVILSLSSSLVRVMGVSPTL